MVLYVRRESSFISTQFIVLNLVGWFGVFSDKFFVFDILLLYYWNTLRSSIIFCVCSGDIYIYIFFRYFFSCSTCSILFLTVTELFCGEFAETFIILSAILLLIKSPVTCGVLWIALLEAFLKTSVADCLAWSKNFRL